MPSLAGPIPQSPIAVTRPVIFTLQHTSSGTRAMQIRIFKITGGTSLLLSYTQYPDAGTTNRYTFDIQEVLEDQLSYNLIPVNLPVSVLSAPNSLYEFSVEFVDMVYNATTNVLNEGATLSFPVSLKALNASIPASEDSSLHRFVLGEAYPARFLTNAPASKRIRPGESEYLAGYHPGLEGTVSLMVRSRRKSGTLLSHIHTLGTVNTKPRFAIQVGPQALNDLNPAQAEPSSVRYYTVQLMLNDNYQNNYFRDGSYGTFETENGESIVTDYLVALNTVSFPHNGDKSLKAFISTMPQGGAIWYGKNEIELVPGITYEARGYACMIDAHSATGDIYIGFDGFTDATVTVIDKYALPGPWATWVQMHTRIVVGQDNKGRLKTVFNSTGSILNVYFDDFTIETDATFPISEVRTFEFDHACNEGAVRVHWLNRLGAFDSFTFTGEKKSVKTKSTTFQKYLPYTFSTINRGQQVQSVQASETIKCSTDALTDEEILWLEELLTSPEVFIQRDSNYVPVIISNGSFETVNTEKNIKVLHIELDLANDLVLQRN